MDGLQRSRCSGSDPLLMAGLRGFMLGTPEPSDPTGAMIRVFSPSLIPDFTAVTPPDIYTMTRDESCPTTGRGNAEEIRELTKRQQLVDSQRVN